MTGRIVLLCVPALTAGMGVLCSKFRRRAFFCAAFGIILFCVTGYRGIGGIGNEFTEALVYPYSAEAPAVRIDYPPGYIFLMRLCPARINLRGLCSESLCLDFKFFGRRYSCGVVGARFMSIFLVSSLFDIRLSSYSAHTLFFAGLPLFVRSSSGGERHPGPRDQILFVVFFTDTALIGARIFLSAITYGFLRVIIIRLYSEAASGAANFWGWARCGF